MGLGGHALSGVSRWTAAAALGAKLASGQPDRPAVSHTDTCLHSACCEVNARPAHAANTSSLSGSLRAMSSEQRCVRKVVEVQSPSETSGTVGGASASWDSILKL